MEYEFYFEGKKKPGKFESQRALGKWKGMKWGGEISFNTAAVVQVQSTEGQARVVAVRMERKGCML